MFERFTDRARRVVVLAQEEARAFNHNYIGTEHLLLGLVSEQEGVAAQTLASVDLTIEGIRQAVDDRVGRGQEAPKGHIPFTPRAKKVLELSLRQALKLGHDYIGTEHILLGLLDEGEGVAAQILLSNVSGGLEAVETALLTQLVDVGAVSRGERHMAQTRRRMQHASFGIGADDEIVKRLEAIEARLSAIERLLREQRGEETG
jgi:ATP-dependent Clp protease ATP-binding subunit ClpC